MSPAADFLRILSNYRHFLGNGIQAVDGWLAMGEVSKARGVLRLLHRRLSQDRCLEKVADPEATLHLLRFRSLLEEGGVEAEIVVGSRLRGFHLPAELASRIGEQVQRCSSCPRRGERALFSLDGQDHLLRLEWRMECPDCPSSFFQLAWPSLVLASGHVDGGS